MASYQELDSGQECRFSLSKCSNEDVCTQQFLDHNLTLSDLALDDLAKLVLNNDLSILNDESACANKDASLKLGVLGIAGLNKGYRS